MTLDLSEEKNDVIAVIRALLLARNCFTTARDIEVEYHDREGEHIPWKRFGFRNVADFLRTSGEFNVVPQPNGQVSRVLHCSAINCQQSGP